MNVKRLTDLTTSWWTILILLLLVTGLLVILVVRYSHHTPTKIDMTSPPGTAQSSTNNTNLKPSPATPKDTCDVKRLKSSLALEGAAGNIYGTYTITNSDTKACQIVGNKYLQASYSLSIKNLAVSNQGAIGPALLTLNPGASVYATLHYPNGPQCSSATQPVAVGFSYPISSQTNLTLSGENGSKQVTVQACQTNTDITTIQVSSLAATKPY